MARYHDYVIKDGKFIGKFEEMYQRFDDPWHQASFEGGYLSCSRDFVTLNISKLKIKSMVEFGCGLGYYTDFIKRRTGINIKGVDISPTAVKKAKENFPALDFSVDEAKNINEYSRFEAVFLRISLGIYCRI